MYGVWGKVMFSQVSVILFTGGRVHTGCTLDALPRMHPQMQPPWDAPHTSRCAHLGCIPQMHPLDAPPPWMHPLDAPPAPVDAPLLDAPPTSVWTSTYPRRQGEQAVGTHSTGMHTCCFTNMILVNLKFVSMFYFM